MGVFGVRLPRRKGGKVSIKHVRLATEVEVARIKEGSDIGGEPFAVFALDNNQGEADIAVVKGVVELDPVFFAKTSNSVTRGKFVQLVEERLMGMGIKRFGCRISAADTHWRKILEEWGYKAQSSEPEIQMIRNL